MTEEQTKLSNAARNLLIGHYKKHVFLCIGESCCSPEVGQAAWDALKKELKDRDLSLSAGEHACYRTKVGCLRVCQSGPIAVVYPEGTYYSDLSAERIPQFVEEHLVQNRPVEEWIFARNPLPLVEAKGE